MIPHRQTQATIDLQALRHNILEAKKRFPASTIFMPIIKANAYGHGAVQCARVLRETGIRHFGVATVEEGFELCTAGVQENIYILGGLLTDNLQDVLAHRLKPVIHSLDDLTKLGIYLKKIDKPYAIHLKLDTGMGRLGFLPSQTEEVISSLKKYSQIQVEGILTHMARADEADPEPSERQFLLFQKLKKIYAEQGIKAPFYHIANSAAILDERVQGYEMARPGIMLYGSYPHPRFAEKLLLKPVMTLKTRIISLKLFPAGSALSYGGTHVTKSESLIAVVCIGYADGYPRLLSNRAQVLVGGQRAPVVGRICMDLTMVDVSAIPGVHLGDEVVLFGEQKGQSITVEEVATWAETISYEIFCGISSRVPRVYLGI